MGAKLWEKKSSLFWSALLSFGITFSSLMCMATAFSLPVDPEELCLVCLVLTLALSLTSLNKHGLWIQLGLLLTLAFFAGEELTASVEALVYRVSEIYDMAYHWGVLYWSPAPPKNHVATLALCFFAYLQIWLASDALMRRRPSGITVIVGLLPLLLCMVVTDILPEMFWLFCLLASLLLLVMTQTTRRREEKQGNRLTALLLVPALLCTSLLFWAVPREGYQPPQSLPSFLQDIFQQFNTGSGIGTGASVENVDLTQVGFRPVTRFAIMDVETQKTGVMYLRGQAYDTYTGLQWEVSSYSGEDPYWPTEGLGSAFYVVIRLRMEKDRLYLPYYVPQLSQISQGWLENDGGERYTLQWQQPAAGGPTLTTPVTQSTLVNQCLQLPKTTQAWASDILEELSLDSMMTTEEKARAIEDYVRQSARYYKYPGKMPSDRTDFAQWFLEEMDQGYCVHFATAATVLLRAAGIPARYVTGYLATLEEGTTVVTADQSHAWVEYLDEQRGWTVLDATPEEETAQPTETTAPTQPTQTTPPATTEPTEPTAPSQNATGPSQTTTPSGTEPTTPEPVEEPMDWTPIVNSLLVLVYGFLTVAAIWGQYALRLGRRRKKRGRGGPNDRALTMWKEIVHFSRLYRKPLPEELIALAEKAKFSQHTLTSSEVKAFRAALQSLSLELAQKSWYKRLFWKLIFAAE